MLNLKIKLDGAATVERLNKLRADLADRSALHHEMGLGVEMVVKEHLRALPGKQFYKQAAESVHMESSADAAVISITKRGIGLRRHGGVVKASGRTSDVTGRPIKNLALPVNGAEAVGEWRGKLAWIPNRGGGDTTGYLVDGENYTISRGKNKGKRGTRPTAGGKMRYILRRKTTHSEDASILPSDSQLLRSALTAAKIYLELTP